MKLSSIRYLTAEGFKNVWVNRLMAAASIGVLVACMVLMGAALLLSVNADKALGSLQDQNVALVYLEDATTEEEAQIAYQKISAVDNVNSKETKFISKEEGMQSLIDDMGEQYNELFTWLDDEEGSFLPYGIQVSFEDLSKFNSTIDEISAIEHVDHINHSGDLAEMIVGIRKMVTIAGFWIIALLLITAMVIIANTIKITMFSRKLEISIMKAVGATNNFVRFPFIIEGMIFGLISAILSTGVLYFAYRVTLRQIEKIMSIQAVPFGDVALYLFGAFCALGVLAGCVGSIISIGKYLKREGSELSAF